MSAFHPRRTSARGPDVRSLLPLLKMMMLAVLLWTGNIAHAAEAECSPAAATDVAHVDQGQDQEAPGDAGKATQHQHTGCHGHHMANPPSAFSESVSLDGNSLKFGRLTLAAVGTCPDSLLRPPIA